MDSVRVLVAYDSLTGNVEKMAQAVAEGVREQGGVVDVCRVDEVDIDKVMMVLRLDALPIAVP